MSRVRSTSDPCIHVFLGTKAQYIKTAPLLRLLDSEGLEYRLIDAGQHGSLSQGLRAELGVRDPDHFVGGTKDINTIFQAVVWSLRIAARLWSPRRLREEVFGGRGGICVIHGDTPTTFLSALIARRAGLEVAHLESGLTSGSYWHPFPEEIIRALVSRVADILFAPTPQAARFLQAKKLRGQVVQTSGNTSHEALAWTNPVSDAHGGPAIITMHRVENLNNSSRVEQMVRTACTIASTRPVEWVLHGPTEATLNRGDRIERLERAGVEMTPLLPHAEFVRRLADAPFVITDGGSIQEECARLGVPTLLWRNRTERDDGLGENVVLSHYDDAEIEQFLEGFADRRRAPEIPTSSPSREVLDVLLDRLDDSDLST